jgi:hypothetical protein
VPPEGPARGWRLARRVSEGVSEFVWGAREAESVGRGRERSACRGPRMLTRTWGECQDRLPLSPRRDARFLRPRGSLKRDDEFPDTTGKNFDGGRGWGLLFPQPHDSLSLPPHLIRDQNRA